MELCSSLCHPQCQPQSFTAVLLCSILFRQIVPAPHPSAPILWLPDISYPAAVSPFPAHPAASQITFMIQPAFLPTLAPASVLPHGCHLTRCLGSLAKLTIPILAPLASLKNGPLIPNFENFIRRPVVLEGNTKFSFVTWLFWCL